MKTIFSIFLTFLISISAFANPEEVGQEAIAYESDEKLNKLIGNGVGHLLFNVPLIYPAKIISNYSKPVQEIAGAITSAVIDSSIKLASGEGEVVLDDKHPTNSDFAP